jgi:hypothetical protein
MKYKMMTATEAIDKLFALKTKTKTLDFTFDDLDLDPDLEPSGWYGMKLMKIFDEEDYVFVMGYYGGGSTEAYDIYGMVDSSDDEDCVKEYCTKRLQDFMNTWCSSFEPCEKICVEIKED